MLLALQWQVTNKLYKPTIPQPFRFPFLLSCLPGMSKTILTNPCPSYWYTHSKVLKSCHLTEKHHSLKLSERFPRTLGIIWISAIPLSSTCIRWDNSAVPPLRDVLPYPLQDSWLCIQIISWDIEKALHFRSIEACGSMVMIWSAPAIDSIFAAILVDIGAHVLPFLSCQA